MFQQQIVLNNQVLIEPVERRNPESKLMSFATAVNHSINAQETRTENGMRAHESTGSRVLNLFSTIGSARGVDLRSQLQAALSESEDLTVRTLLWARDIREGAGERQTFRNLLVALEAANPELAGDLMHKIPELGRWDDLFAYTDPLNRQKAFQMYAEALRNGNALAAKWAPREKSTKSAVAAELRKTLGLSPREYRKMLSTLTNVVEEKMCAKEWNSINFSHVPSVASARYQKAFGHNAPEAYSNYIRQLQKPVLSQEAPVKINAGAIHPHEVVRSVARGNQAVADAQWAALPNYVGNASILPMVDVSGSMGSLGYGHSGSPHPIEVAVALGLYLSEKNRSGFKDLVLTFSSRPEFYSLRGTLSQRMSQLSTMRWEMNTNLHAAFDRILSVAIQHRVSQVDMPQMLLVLSDMQFDQCTRYDDSAMEMIRRKYRDAGYAVPRIVFWNLNARYASKGSPIQFDTRGTAHVSGYSPSIMKAVLANDLEEYTPYNVMLKTLMNDRYNP